MGDAVIERGVRQTGDGTLLEVMADRLPRMVEELAALVSIESPSEDLDALRLCANYLSTLGTTLLGFAPEVVERDGRPHLLWIFGATPRVLLVGHFDTVHPMGTIDVFPFSDDGEIIRGPGTCDMKGGLVVALHALAVLRERYGDDALDGVALFLNADEELGSPSSVPVLAELATTARVALVFENGGGNGELKTERRGRSDYELRFTGRSVHAGMRPQDGVNAIAELAAQYERVTSLSDFGLGTSVTPTLASAGTTFNTVPDLATMRLDVRCALPEEQHRVDREIREIRPVIPGAEVEVRGSIQIHPMPSHVSQELVRLAVEVSAAVGVEAPGQMAAGGSSNACDLAGLGLRTIDGLGTIGEDDHTHREWMTKRSLVTRSALAAGMVASLVGLPVDGEALPPPADLRELLVG